jgi:hypothetical protein
LDENGRIKSKLGLLNLVVSETWRAAKVIPSSADVWGDEVIGQ